MAINSKKKKWQVTDKYPDSFSDIFPEVHPILKQLLFNRGLDTQAKVDEFLHPNYSQDLHDPFLFRDMTKACERIWQALEKQEKVVVFGDYDADGVCSASLLISFLKQLGLAAQVYIPHRETEGYGLNMLAVEGFIKDKFDLLITVDCGTTNIEEVKKAMDSGLDVIVVDHHHVPAKRVKPLAFLNCSDTNDNYPFSELAAVGMVFKLVQGLIKYISANKKSIKIKEGSEKWLLDLVAIATVTDVVPIIGENHTLLKYGMLVLNKTKRPGLIELIKLARLEMGKVYTWHLGFIIGPRLNAAGRIDHANTAYTLLITDNKEEALSYAGQLNEANKKRQQLTENFVKQAKEQVAKQVEAKDNILIAYNPDWDLGIVGLVAGRLVEAYSRPALAITKSQGKIMGSGRSIAGFDIIAAVESQSKYLSRFGGHKQACGFSVKTEEDLKKFDKAIKQAAKNIDAAKLEPSLLIDARVELKEVDWQLFAELNKLEPFGERNPQPKFLTLDLQVIGVDFVGDNKKHLRLMVGDESGLVRKTIGFGLGQAWGDLQMGDRIDMVYEVSVNEWNGNRELQLKIVDLKK